MNDDDQKHKDQFDAALPLPLDDNKKLEQQETEPESNPAAELIRKKVEAAYANEPSAKTEGRDLERAGGAKLSRHQKFIYELTSSGKPLHEVQIAWHEYYAGLPDDQKHEVWQEFYKTHSEASQYKTAGHQPGSTRHEGKKSSVGTGRSLPSQLTRSANIRATRALAGIRNQRIPANGGVKVRPYNQFRSLIFGIGVGCIVLVIFLFSFFNERFIAPFIQPSRNVSGAPIISDSTTIGPNPEIIIPKINVEIPVVYTVNTIDDAAVENALEGGVVHYADTALPGQDGNIVIVGHSSNNIFNPGRYKFAFVLLSRLDNGDTFYLQKDGHRYTYEVYKKQIVSPTDVSVLGPADKPATATLITCDPPGTSNNRLVVTAEQIDPSPSANIAQAAPSKLASETTIIPGNSPSLWSRFVHWVWG